jgi:PTS system nitrogen regulatory IIA component
LWPKWRLARAKSLSKFNLKTGAILSLQQILRPEHVLLGLEVTSKKRLFEEIGFLFEQATAVPRANITDSLFARERLGSTGLGYGVAIPHGRIKGLKEPRLAALQLKNGIGFDAADGEPVTLLFALLVPENANQTHLDLLAEVAELLGDDLKRDALESAKDIETFMSVIHAGSLL